MEVVTGLYGQFSKPTVRLVRSANRKFSDTIPCVLDENQRSRPQVGEAFSEYRRETLIHGIGSFITQPKENDARFNQDAKCEYLPEVEVKGEDDA